MAEGEEGGEGKLPCVDHGPLNEGAVGKRKMYLFFLEQLFIIKVSVVGQKREREVS